MSHAHQLYKYDGEPTLFPPRALSHDRIQGVNMREIEDRAHWGPKSKAIKA